MIYVELQKDGRVRVEESVTHRGLSFRLMDPNHPDFSQGGALLHLITGINRGLRFIETGGQLIGVGA
jgi:hypothetical protein